MSQAAERIYYDEPTTLEFTATVTAIREVARVDGKQVWQIALDRSAFYPTSGGQPHDTGTLTATARSGATLEVPVTAVEEDESGEVWHTTAKPLQEDIVIRGSVNKARRRGHMQQHTGQHLLSAVLQRECAVTTTSFHLGEETSTIDLDVQDLTAEQLLAAETAVNDAVASALPLAIRYATREAAENMLAQGLLRKLPPRDGRIRLIEIPGIDLNACGGTHVATTAEIGPVLLRGTERVRGALRLSFVCGGRAIAAAREDFCMVKEAAQSLSTSPAEMRNSIVRLQDEGRQTGKERAALLLALARSEAMRLGAGGAPVLHALDSAAPCDAGYAKTLAAQLVSITAAPFALIVAPENDRAAVVLAAKAGVLDCGAVLRVALQQLGGRGGGNRELAQGGLPLAQLSALQLHLQAVLPR